ncbi:serine hydrolase domain-containing protein [Paenibacillus pini]|uniref:Beta-lactamase-related domain-containing protein n=1 Tax=Paenibacillus pini JCM 16418 TaxID=1236976 RepID=W7Z114_9BACL|nr:serine hydrolase domain-containing protein [Paenibacillus pini]GAF10671.1 hypothetical protein JCM16418_4890 [Paenibacillus pini JCM 16418]
MINSLEIMIDEEIRSNDFPVGGAVVVIKDGNAVYSKGFGKARIDVEDRAFTPDTIISIQSISKSFTVASLLHLVDEGNLDLDAPLIKYLPYFRTTEKQKSDLITVKHLLSHTAGFSGEIGIGNLACPNIAEFSVYTELKKQVRVTDDILHSIHNREEITRFFKSVTLANSPGFEWNYCTDAYIIAADLFEKVSGLNWNDYMEEKIFNTLKLTRTTLSAEKVQQDEDHADYYTNNGQILVNTEKFDLNSDMFNSPFPMNSLGAPMGFIYSSANDLGTYLSSYMGQPTILPRNLVDQLQEPIWRFDDETGYSLGWGTRRQKNYNIIEHGGGFPGVSTYVCVATSEKVAVAVVSNHDQTPTKEICYRVMDVLCSEF